jgi:hypothetical protein
MRGCLVSAVMLFMVTLAFSDDGDTITLGQNKKKNLDYRYNIGASGGFITGPGISYRQWITSKYGFQVTLFPYYRSSESGDEANLSLSGIGLRMISETQWLNLFGYFGIRGQYTKEKYYENDWNNAYRKENKVQAGFGPGVELKISRLSLNLMVGLRGSTNFERDKELNFSVESSAFYRF